MPVRIAYPYRFDCDADPLARDWSRRQFLVRAGVTAGALAGGSLLAGPGRLVATATAADGLTDARRATFTSLADAVLTDASVRLDPTLAAQVTQDFEREYASRPASFRAQADVALDRLERALARSFSNASRRDRHASLQQLRRVSRPDPGPEERARLAIGEAVFGLVESVVSPRRDGELV